MSVTRHFASLARRHRSSYHHYGGSSSDKKSGRITVGSPSPTADRDKSDAHKTADTATGAETERKQQPKQSPADLFSPGSSPAVAALISDAGSIDSAQPITGKPVAASGDNTSNINSSTTGTGSTSTGSSSTAIHAPSMVHISDFLRSQGVHDGVALRELCKRIIQKPPSERSENDLDVLFCWATTALNCKLFSELKESVVKAVCAKMVWEEIAADSVVFRQGDTSDKLYIVIKGSVSVWIGRKKQPPNTNTNTSTGADKTNGTNKTKPGLITRASSDGGDSTNSSAPVSGAVETEKSDESATKPTTGDSTASSTGTGNKASRGEDEFDEIADVRNRNWDWDIRMSRVSLEWTNHLMLWCCLLFQCIAIGIDTSNGRARTQSGHSRTATNRRCSTESRIARSRRFGGCTQITRTNQQHWFRRDVFSAALTPRR